MRGKDYNNSLNRKVEAVVAWSSEMGSQNEEKKQILSE